MGLRCVQVAIRNVIYKLCRHKVVLFNVVASSTVMAENLEKKLMIEDFLS